MEATVNGKPFAGELSCGSYESLSLTVTEPEETAGFSVSTQDGGYRIRMNGLTDDLPQGFLKPGAPLRLLFDAVRAAVFTNHGAFVREKETGGYTADLTVNGVPVSVSFTEDGLLRTITADALTAAFTDTAPPMTYSLAEQ